MPKTSSLVTFLLDKSGSMDSCKAATIEGFNGYLGTLQAEQDADIDFTFLQFDTQSLDKIHVAIPVRQAKLLNEASYLPRGGTPLIDASVKTIRAVEASLAERMDKPSIVICIQTDGEENASREHTWEELRGLIAAKQADGWEFNFLGAGIDAYAQGARMGISGMNTMSYDSTDIGATRSAFAASATNAGNFATGRSASTSYSTSDREAAGDAFWGGRKGMPPGISVPTPTPPASAVSGYASVSATAPASVGKLDLSKLKATSTLTPPAARKVVADLKL